VIAHKEAVIHFVEVVAGQNEDIHRPVTLDEIEVLPDGVGGSPVPVLTDSLLGRHHLHEMPEFGAEDVPACFEVVVEDWDLYCGRRMIL